MNKLLPMQFYLITIYPKLHHRNWQNYVASFVLLTCRLLCTFLTSPLMLFFIQPLSGNSVINCRAL